MTRIIREEWKNYGPVLLKGNVQDGHNKARYLPGSLPGEKRRSVNPVRRVGHQPWRSRRKQCEGKSKRLFFSLPPSLWAKLKAKIDTAESYPAEYLLKLVQADLCRPVDEANVARSLGLQKQIASLTSVLTRQHHVFSQIAAALTSGKQCLVTRDEVDAAWKQHASAIKEILKLGFEK